MRFASASWARPLLVLAALLSTAMAAGDGSRNRVMESVVLVLNGAQGEGGSGSGTVVAAGYVLTNNHVVEGGSQWLVLAPGSRDPKPAELVWRRKEQDLALLKVSGLDLKPVPLAGTATEAGAEVWAIGYPEMTIKEQLVANNSLKPSMSDGMISQTYLRPWDPGLPAIAQIQHTASINPGNSGGPLIDGCGRIVGVNTAGYNAVRSSSTYFASASSVAIDAIKTLSPGVSPAISGGGCSTEAGFPWAWLIAGMVVLGATTLILRYRPAPALVPNTGGEPKPKPKSISPGVSPPPRAGRRLVLTGLSPESGVLRLEIDRASTRGRDGVVIGRSSELSDLQVVDRALSRRHLRIVERDGTLMVEDLNSQAGSSLGGKALEPFRARAIAPGARLRLGPVELNLTEE